MTKDHQRIRSKVEEELIEYCGETYSDKTEKRSEFLRRLAVATSLKLREDALTYGRDKLNEVISEEAFDWLEEAWRHIEKFPTGSLPPFPDDEDIIVKRFEAFAKSTSKRNNNWARHKKSAAYRIKEIMLEDGLDQTPRQVHDRLISEGFEYGRDTTKITVINFRQCIRFIWEKNLLKERPKGI